MTRYVIRRVLQFIPVVLAATFIVYALVFAIPGDPIRALSGDRPLSDAVQQTLRDRYNLDDPLLVQYGKYLLAVIQGDFGTTFQGRPVGDIIAQRFPVSLRLAVVAFLFQGLIGVVAGILAALRRKGFLDTLVQVSTVILVAIPTLVFTFLSQEEIADLERRTEERPQARAAQRTLAELLTTLVHGEEETRKVKEASLALFGRADLSELDARTLDSALSEVPKAEVEGPVADLLVTDLFAQSGLTPSKSAARRAIQEGGAYVNNVKVTDVEARLSAEDVLQDRFVVLRKGKRNVGGIVLRG